MNIKKEKERILKLIAGTTFVYDSEATEERFKFIEKAKYSMDTQISVFNESRTNSHTLLIKDFRTDKRHGIMITDESVNSLGSIVQFEVYIIQCLQRGMHDLQRERDK